MYPNNMPIPNPFLTNTVFAYKAVPGKGGVEWWTPDYYSVLNWLIVEGEMDEIEAQLYMNELGDCNWPLVFVDDNPLPL